MGTKRKDVLETNEIYHVFNRSIAEYKIFNNKSEYYRMLNSIQFYQFPSPTTNLNKFIRSLGEQKHDFREKLLNTVDEKNKLVDIIAYILMPTHVHLILKQLVENGISIFIRNSFNSYSHYFNLKHDRQGPLWQSEFKNVLVENDAQLLHLTRYIHLNPTTARLTEKPEEWEYSSYREYLGEVDKKDKICKFSDLLDVKPSEYRNFVNNRIDYQRKLKDIEHLCID